MRRLCVVGFAGNAGGEKCACGMTQRCDGGVADACHSDVNDFTWKTDEGVFIDKSVLPVSRMCIGYDTSGRRHRPRDVYYKIRDLTCAPNQFGASRDGCLTSRCPRVFCHCYI